MFIDFIKEVFLPVFIITVVAIVIVVAPIYYSSCKEAKIFNNQNGTTWTCSDFFWAGKQINSQTQSINLIKK